MKNFLFALFLLSFTYACGPKKKSAESAGAEMPVAASGYPAELVAAIEKGSFKDFSGTPVSVTDFKGKVVLLDFWETWCGPCIRSFPTLDRLMKEYPDDFAVIAVTPGFSDTPEDVQQFRQANPYPFVFVMDEGLSTALNIEGIPYKVILTADGKYLTTVMGAHPDDYEKMKEIIEKYRKS